MFRTENYTIISRQYFLKNWTLIILLKTFCRVWSSEFEVCQNFPIVLGYTNGISCVGLKPRNWFKFALPNWETMINQLTLEELGFQLTFHTAVIVMKDINTIYLYLPLISETSYSNTMEIQL